MPESKVGNLPSSTFSCLFQEKGLSRPEFHGLFLHLLAILGKSFDFSLLGSRDDL